MLLMNSLQTFYTLIMGTFEGCEMDKRCVAAGAFEPVLLVDTIVKRGLDFADSSQASANGYREPPYRMPAFTIPTDTSDVYLAPSDASNAAGPADELVLRGTAVSFTTQGSPFYLSTVHGFTIVLRYRALAPPTAAQQTLLHLSDIPDAGGTLASSASLKILHLRGDNTNGTRLALHWAPADKVSRALAPDTGTSGGAMYVTSKELEDEDQEATFVFRMQPASVASGANVQILRNGQEFTVRLRFSFICLLIRLHP